MDLGVGEIALERCRFPDSVVLQVHVAHRYRRTEGHVPDAGEHVVPEVQVFQVHQSVHPALGQALQVVVRQVELLEPGKSAEGVAMNVTDPVASKEKGLQRARGTKVLLSDFFDPVVAQGYSCEVAIARNHGHALKDVVVQIQLGESLRVSKGRLVDALNVVV